MEELREKTVTQEFLQEILPHFEICARRAVEGVLGLPTYAPRGFRLAPSKIGTAQTCCTIQCWNTEGSVTLSVGVPKPDRDSLVPDAGSEIVLDALGEVMNVLAGRLIGVRRFVEGFGHMAMSPPEFSDAGLMADEGHSLHGMLVAKSTRLYFGMVLGANAKEEV